METSNQDLNPAQEQRSEFRRNSSGRVLAGVVLVGIGGVLLAKQYGVNFPNWVFSWQMLLIVIGFYVGARHSFRTAGWLIPVIVGTVFLVEDVVPELSFHQYIWPVLIMVAGLFMIFRPRRKKNDYWRSWRTGGKDRLWEKYHDSFRKDADRSSENFIDSVSVFGATRKNIIAKDFKGGDLTSFFGGTYLNLTQADFTGTITLEITNILSGTKLIIPSHWNIKSELVCVFGGVDDKRELAKEGADATKVLKLVGTCVFGGIEIKSF